jgi:hypothetical protein
MTFRPVVAKLFRADGQTDMTKHIVAFRNFANAPKSRKSVSSCQFRETFYACDYGLKVLFYMHFHNKRFI